MWTISGFSFYRLGAENDLGREGIALQIAGSVLRSAGIHQIADALHLIGSW